MPSRVADTMSPQKHQADIVTIDALNHDGRGVARVNGKVVFIDGALPGERVSFQYISRRRSYDAGRIVQILEPAADRVTHPECQYFGTCGGCVLQHLQADAQIQAKEKILRDSLQRIGNVSPKHWLPPLTGPVWGYRRKARLSVRLVPKKGGVLVGFHERRKSFVTPLADCKTLDPRLARLLPHLPKLVASLSHPDRLPQIEVAAGDEDSALVFRHLTPLTEQDHKHLVDFGVRHAVQVHLQPHGPTSTHALWPAEAPLLSYRLPEHDVELRFKPTDFTQVNASVNQRMVGRAIELLNPQPNENILDLFCGVGNFTIPLARYAASVIGVETNSTSLARARDNAVHNGLTNITFLRSDLDDAKMLLPDSSINVDKMLLDPPRNGAMAAIKNLKTERVTQILYISCHPATLARDSEYLVHKLGYSLISACVMDMFPQTSHVESMAHFGRT